MLSKREWRIQLREKRRNLSPSRQRSSAIKLSRHLHQLPELASMQHIAVYWPNDGEIDPRLFMALAILRGVQIYLPVIRADGLMQFAAYYGSAGLKRNSLGIPEPQWRRSIVKPLWKIDAVLMPLVGFDRTGNRLGMGAGFYDRALADVRHRVKRPQCWGLAHSCQQVDSLPCDDWDIPLRGIITEKGARRFLRNQ